MGLYTIFFNGSRRHKNIKGACPLGEEAIFLKQHFEMNTGFAVPEEAEHDTDALHQYCKENGISLGSEVITHGDWVNYGKPGIGTEDNNHCEYNGIF